MTGFRLTIIFSKDQLQSVYCFVVIRCPDAMYSTAKIDICWLVKEHRGLHNEDLDAAEVDSEEVNIKFRPKIVHLLPLSLIAIIRAAAAGHARFMRPIHRGFERGALIWRE